MEQIQIALIASVYIDKIPRAIIKLSVVADISVIYRRVGLDSVLLCYKESYEISCTADDQYIVIEKAVFGYLPSYQRSSSGGGSSKLCSSEAASAKANAADCAVSLMRNVSRRCSGSRSCQLEVVYSQYLQKESLPCPQIASKQHLLALYIAYECVPRGTSIAAIPDR